MLTLKIAYGSVVHKLWTFFFLLENFSANLDIAEGWFLFRLGNLGGKSPLKSHQLTALTPARATDGATTTARWDLSLGQFGCELMKRTSPINFLFWIFSNPLNSAMNGNWFRPPAPASQSSRLTAENKLVFSTFHRFQTKAFSP